MIQLKLIYEELRKEILFKTILLIGNKNGSFYNVCLGKILLQVAGKNLCLLGVFHSKGNVSFNVK